VQLAKTWGSDEIAVRTRRKELGVRAVFSRVDTCAAEFESFTPYLYSNYESSCEADPAPARRS
jgi:carbamoyl-phosphate synthase large subunit